VNNAKSFLFVLNNFLSKKQKTEALKKDI